jgi:hypothetical protein
MANTPLYPKTLVERKKWNDYRKGIWGDSFNWSWIRPWNQIKYLVIHHSVTKHEATPDDIALLHKARGWGGIGYHFVITKDGVVHYVGDISTARANVLNKNEQVIGIMLVGDFTKHLPTDAQIESAHDLCKFFLTETPSIPTLNSWDQVVGHKDLGATACPGSSWPNDMRWRILNRKIYSPEPTPEPTPTPTPTPTPPTVITDENQRIRIGKILDTDYGDRSLKDIREIIKQRDEEIAKNKTFISEAIEKAKKDQEKIQTLENKIKEFEGMEEKLRKEIIAEMETTIITNLFKK